MKNLFIFLLIFLSIRLFAVTYYIDYTNGNDSNSGTSQTSAWKTLSKIENYNFQPGDSILLKKGEVWHERMYLSSSGSAGNYIYVGAYGSGDKPQINVLQDYNLTWTHDSGNIWYNTEFTDNPKRVLKNGVEILDAASGYFDELGTNIPDLVEWYWGKKDSNDNQDKLYLYSIDDPNNSTFTMTAKAYALELFDVHYIIFDGLEFIGSNLACVTIYSCSHIHLLNLDVGKYANYGIEMTCYKPNGVDWQKNEFNIIDNCNINTYYTFDYSNAGTQSGKSNRGPREGVLFRRNTRNCELKNSFIKNYCHANINIFAPIENEQPVEGQEVRDNKIHHNTIVSPDLAYGGRIAIDGYCHHNEIYDNVIKNTSVQSQLNGHENHIHHNIFKHTINSPLKDWKVGHAISLQGYYSKVYGNIIENNIMIDCEAAGVFLSGNNSDGDVTDNYFRNNIMFNCGTDYSNRGLSIETDFNTYSNDGNHFLNNLIFCSNTGQTIYYYGNTYNVSGFNGQNGTHNHEIIDNISNDPLFADENNEDYHIPENSPCVDAAVMPLATEDYEGNTIPHGQAADIGLYENQYDLALTGIDNFSCTRRTTGILLSWEYSEESNLRYNNFAIEKSLNGMDWRSIGIVKILGNKKIYNYLDNISKLGTIYYRLKIEGNGIKPEYSDIISIEINNIEKGSDIVVFPNPVQDKLFVILPKYMNGSTNLCIYNSLGKLTKYIKVFNNKINTIDLSNEPNGIYYLVIYIKNKKYLKKILLK